MPKDKVTINMATLPERQYFASRAIHSLLPQCDVMNVVFNNYDKIPDWVAHLPKVHAVIGDNHLGDAMRYTIPPEPGYFFTVDDDLIYPPTYVSDMIIGIEDYKRKCIVTLHGRNLKPGKRTGYYDPANRLDVHRCLMTVNRDERVEFGGTGVMAWHTDTFTFDVSKVERRNMADIWVGIQAFQAGVPIMVLAHEIGYLTYNLPQDRWTIHGAEHGNPETAAYQAEIINKYMRSDG